MIVLDIPELISRIEKTGYSLKITSTLWMIRIFGTVSKAFKRVCLYSFF